MIPNQKGATLLNRDPSRCVIGGYRELVGAEGPQNTPDVVDSVFMQSEAALLVRAVDELLYVLSDVVRQLFKEHLRFIVSERPHGPAFLQALSLALSLLFDPPCPRYRPSCFTPG